jgi:CCDC93, coiled-coil domain
MQESSKELSQITDILLAAGYFRARVASLSPFDKVRAIQILGGIAWCITLANENITIEFSDEMNMRKKM